jgi:virginiamycin B lyase
MNVRFRVVSLLVTAFLIGTVVNIGSSLQAAQVGADALTGRVTSSAEGAMEGVLVSARRPGSDISITVSSDAQRRYSFPASRLASGAYGLSIRAIGYDLAAPTTIVVKPRATMRADLRLRKTDHLEDQMSDTEWILSAPGTDTQRSGLVDCNGCHTLQRVVDSYHTAEEWRNIVLPRMANYSFSSFWLKPQPFRSVRGGRSPFRADLPEYLASINQSTGPRKWPLKTLPRLTGASTHVIVTSYALPDRLTQPHDVVGTSDGSIWFSDFGQQFLGRLEPQTGAVTRFPVPEFKPGYLNGSLDIEVDPDGYLWLANLYQGGVTRFDPKTQTMKQWAVSPAAHPEFTQSSMVTPTHSSADGKVWTNNQDDHSLRRLDPATGTWESFGPYFYPGVTPPKSFNAYGLLTDASNSVWGLDFGGTSIGHFDPKTGTFKIIATPTADARPRRGRVDDRTGLFWFAEFGANSVGVYDTKADNGTIREYLMPTPWDMPYDAVADKSGMVWTGSMFSDRVTRIDPSTGRILDYQLPITTNIRRVWVDNNTAPATLWVGANHEAAIEKVEALP